MNDAKLEQLIKPLIRIYDKIELELIKDIAIRLNTYNGIEGSLKWYLDKLQEIGGFNRESLELISEYAGKSQREVKEILSIAGYDTTTLEKYKEYYDDELLKINPTSLYENVAVKNIINNAVKETNTIMDTIKTKAIQSAKESYMKILTEAYMKVSSGVYSYDEVIKQSLKQMAKDGFTGATYKGGKRLSLEATVRRDVLTKAHQLAGDIQIQTAKELNTNLVYVTQHIGARTRTKYTKEDYEVHADWQGKVYMLDGSSDNYDNFYEKTGYGELLGLCGVNCRHHFYPTFEWETHQKRINAEENEKAYQLSQQQRAYERKIRALKREKEVNRIIGDKEELKSINQKIKNINSDYNTFIEENNLQRDYNREYIEKYLIKIDNKDTPMYSYSQNTRKFNYDEEIKTFNNINENLNKHIDIESKWSGKINIDDTSNPKKEWDCSITIGSYTNEQSIQHELLHARSISHYGKEEFISCPFEEEATVEFFNKQICLKEGIEYHNVAYSNMVDKLEEICDIINVDKFEFAKELFKIRPSKREEWLRMTFKNYKNNENKLIDLMKEAFNRWMM